MFILNSSRCVISLRPEKTKNKCAYTWYTLTSLVTLSQWFVLIITETLLGHGVTNPVSHIGNTYTLVHSSRQPVAVGIFNCNTEVTV